MLIIETIGTAVWKGFLVGIQIGVSVYVVCTILAFIVFLWVKFAEWCERHVDTDIKAYKPEPKVSKIMKTNKWKLN